MRAVGDKQVPERRRKDGALRSTGVDDARLRLDTVVDAACRAATKVSVQPADDVVVEIRRRDFGEEEVVIDAVKGFANVG